MTISHKPIILIGPMGSGKTSVGRHLADILKRDFFDTDHELIKHTGVNISHIFDIEGESGFRHREANILAKLCTLNDIVLATGGGIIIKTKNRAILRKSGVVIYLRSSIKCLTKRLKYSSNRPLLENVSDKIEAITDIFNQRKHLYESVADITINTSHKKLYVIISEIKKALGDAR